MGTSVACSGERKWFWRVANCKSWFKEGNGCGCFTCCCFICIAHSRFLQTMKIKSLWVDSVRQFPIKWPCNVNLNFVVTAEHPQNGELLEDPDTIGTTGWIFQSTFTLTNHNLECSWICLYFCVCVCLVFTDIQCANLPNCFWRCLWFRHSQCASCNHANWSFQIIARREPTDATSQTNCPSTARATASLFLALYGKRARVYKQRITKPCCPGCNTKWQVDRLARTLSEATDLHLWCCESRRDSWIWHAWLPICDKHSSHNGNIALAS